MVFKTFAVVKLDGATGRVVWRRELNGTAVLHNTQANALALDPSGNVVAAGSVVNGGRAEDFTVVKLDRPTGAVAWRTELSGTDPIPGTSRRRRTTSPSTRPATCWRPAGSTTAGDSRT